MKMKLSVCLMGALMAGALLQGLIVSADAQETKYAAGLSSAAVMFAGDGAGKCAVDSIYSTTDKSGGCIKVYARGGAFPVAPSATPTNGQAVIAISNAAFGYTNADMVIYRHVDGVLDYATISASTASNVTLSAGVSEAGSVEDRLFEIQLKSQFDFDTAGAAIGTNKYGSFGGPRVFCGMGPVRVVQDGTSNAVVNATAH